MDKLRLKGEAGFTLIELLVVIAIIGILAAIAIPQFAAYRRRGFEANVKADLRNAATAEEAYFVTSNTYQACTGCTSTNLPGFNPSTTVAVNSSGGPQAFQLTATHSNCTGDTWTYQSTTGSITGGPCD